MPLQFTIKSWGIFYGDGTEAIGTTIKEWRKAPIENVQCVVINHSDGLPDMAAGKELYMMYDGKHGITFIPSPDKPSVFQEVCELDAIKVGKWASREQFLGATDRARKYLDQENGN